MRSVAGIKSCLGWGTSKLGRLGQSKILEGAVLAPDWNLGEGVSLTGLERRAGMNSYR